MIPLKLFAGACLMLLLICAGCSTEPEYELPRPAQSIYAPQIPEFLKGPAGLLLAGHTGYVARVSATGGADLLKPLTGQLLVRSNLLLFAPDPDPEAKKDSPEPGFSFLWNVAEGRGCLLSEALQGYAPLSSRAHPANQVVLTNTLPSEVVVQSSDGSESRWRLWRSGRHQLPSRISAAEPGGLDLTLTKTRAENLAAETFNPESGMKRYSSPEALVDEIAARHYHLRHPGPHLGTGWDEPAPPAAGPMH